MRGWRDKVKNHLCINTSSSCPSRTRVDCSHPSLAHTLHRQGLGDEHSKIRTAVGMAIASVADHDWPHAWPQLTELLVNGIRNRASPASGAYWPRFTARWEKLRIEHV
jgi:hypothetical protein